MALSSTKNLIIEGSHNILVENTLMFSNPLALDTLELSYALVLDAMEKKALWSFKNRFFWN